MATREKTNHRGVPVRPQIEDDRAETAMRVLANHLIDRFLENNKDDLDKQLIVSKQKDILIMEHR